MAANLFQLDSVFYSFQLSLPSLCLFLLFLTPGSNPRVKPLKIWWVARYPLIRHIGAMLGFKRVLIITTLYRHFFNAVVSICSLNMLKLYVKSYIHIVRGKIDKLGILLLIIFHFTNVFCHLPLPMYRN